MAKWLLPPVSDMCICVTIFLALKHSYDRTLWHSWPSICRPYGTHYRDAIMDGIASQITSLAIVSWTVYADADQRKHLSSASLAFLWGIRRWPVNSPHRWPITWKMFPFDDVIMYHDITDLMAWYLSPINHTKDRFLSLAAQIMLSQSQPRPLK